MNPQVAAVLLLLVGCCASQENHDVSYDDSLPDSSDLEGDAFDVPRDDPIAPSDENEVSDLSAHICELASCSCSCLDGSKPQWTLKGDCDARGNLDGECIQDCFLNCPPDGLPSCAPLPPGQIFSVCIVQDGAAEEYTYEQDVVVTGTVESVGDGRQEGGCLERVSALSIGFSGPNGAGYWFKMRDAQGNTWSVEVGMTGASRPVLGELVSIDAWFAQRPYMQAEGGFYLVAGNNRLVWVGEGTAASEMNPPAGIRFYTGPAFCKGSDQCGSWAAFKIGAVASELGVMVPYGEEVQLGDATIVHGVAVGQTGGVGACPDWHVSHSMMAIYWKRQL